MIRLNCLVPGCRRTRGDRKGDPVTDGMEWICGDHWRAVRPMRRKLYARARRRERNTLGLERGKAAILCWDLWSALKTEAIERAAGL